MDSIVTTEDTIAAIASAISIGKGGVAIIRVSGNDAINSCKKIVQTKSKYAWESHRVFRGFIKENKQNKFIDEVLILVMKSPNSFTGEDVVELHCHGGIIIVNKVLKILLSSNSRIRLANPGEFSQRAFLNGKIDLTQAESINQLINASNTRSAELAFSGVQGEIKQKIEDNKEYLINQLCEIEARVDFEEDFTDFDYTKYLKKIKKVVKPKNVPENKKDINLEKENKKFDDKKNKKIKNLLKKRKIELQSYKIIFILKDVDPKDPTEELSSILRNSEVNFEIEKIERILDSKSKSMNKN